MSARNVVDLIRNDCKVQLCPRTIQKKVKEGAIGSSPLRRSPSGNIPKRHYRNLCVEFKTFIQQINQNNGMVRQCAPKKVGPLLYNVAFGRRYTVENTTLKYWNKLLRRVLHDTATDLNKATGQNTVNRRIRWTNDKNISM